MRTAFLFSGQGAQYPGMMKDLYEKNEEVRKIYNIADQSLKRDISALSFSGTQEELNLTHNTQPCVLAADIAAGRILQTYGVNPDAVAGFSLGEYAAMVFAGVIDINEVFPLIQIRADAMQKAVPEGYGAMVAIVGESCEKVVDLCNRIEGGYVSPANYNSLMQTVVSGNNEGIARLLVMAEQEGIRAIKLAVSAPFHCSLMKSAAERLDEELRKITFSDPILPLYLNYTGEVLLVKEDVKDMLVKQAYNPVQWVKTLQEMQKDGIDTFIECGPGRTLSGLVKRTLKGVKILRIENEKTLYQTLEELGIKNEDRYF